MARILEIETHITVWWDRLALGLRMCPRQKGLECLWMPGFFAAGRDNRGDS
jgi:hypothetical protein